MAQALGNVNLGTREGFWEGALGYRQSLLVVLTAILIGWFFHVRVGYTILPSGQTFAIAAILATVVVAAVSRLAREDRVVRWIAGIPFAVMTTISVIGLSIIGGLVPQETMNRTFGVPSVFGMWPFLFVVALMQLNLVASAARRCWPLTRTNVQYLLAHGGLALTLFGGAYGALGLERMNLGLYVGVPQDVAVDAHGHEIKLPFTATLKEFQMDVFPPTLALARLDEKAEGGMKVTPGSNLVKLAMSERVDGTQLRVLEYLPQAAFNGERWVKYPEKSSAPAAKIEAILPDGKKKVGWISSGSVEVPQTLLDLDGKSAVAMSNPRPKAFRSLVRIEEKGQIRDVKIEVNAPVGVAGAQLYQLSYDEKSGAASPYSVVEVVRDDSVPVVWAGMLAMLFSVTMMMWSGVGTGARRLS